MRRVRSTDTTPERRVRSLLHRLGFRFRLHRKGLPGKPDIILPKYSTIVFVHGCFWHRHPGCPHATTPGTRQHYWLPKFERTMERDRRNQRDLQRLGWNVIVVWECEVRDLDQLARRLTAAITGKPILYDQALPCAQMAAEDEGIYRSTENQNQRVKSDLR